MPPFMPLSVPLLVRVAKDFSSPNGGPSVIRCARVRRALRPRFPSPKVSARMSRDFTDISIVELDPERSFQRSGDFWTKVFTLSAEVPEDWSLIFDEVWAGARCNPKRHARIEEHAIVTICLPEELDGEHMEFLIAAVARTNEAYRLFIAQRPP